MIDTSRNMIYHINNLNTESQRISYQMATGKVLDKGSDDAMLHTRVINVEDKLRVTEGLKLQIEKTQALNTTADASMGEIKLSLETIKLDIMKGLNSGMDRSDKLAISSNLKGVRENIFDRVNTEVDGEYLFTGSVTTNQTFVKDASYDTNGKIDFNGDGFLRKIATQPGSYRDRGVTAYDVAFYNSDTAVAGADLTFSEGERIIDEDGFEWKLNANKNRLQQYDHNGIIYDPKVEIDVSMSPSTSVEIDLGIDANADAKGNYTIKMTGDNGILHTYTYEANGTNSANDVYTDLKAQIEVDFPGAVSAMTFNDKFTLTAITPNTSLKVSIYDSDSNYDIVATNEIEATAANQATQNKYVLTAPATPIGRLFEAKHNYFDDLNIIINALDGFSTKLDGTRGDVITDDKVNDTLRTGLGQTTGQYEATNVGHGELGGRNKIFENAYDKIATQETHYNILIQEIGGADMAKLAMESKSLDLTYQALYSTISKMNQLSLVNFIN